MTVHERRHDSAKGRAVSEAIGKLFLPDTPERRAILGRLYASGYDAASSAKSQRKRRSGIRATSDGAPSGLGILNVGE
jgi:hypothetical protein